MIYALLTVAIVGLGYCFWRLWREVRAAAREPGEAEWARLRHRRRRRRR